MAKRLKKSAKVVGKVRSSVADQFRKRYTKGASIREIAQSSGRSYGFVQRVLMESGVTMRGRGGYNRTKRT
jgi:hypothetical protein